MLMDQMKVIIKTLIGLLIMVSCLMFVINVFFFSGTEYGMGIFGKTGTTLLFLLEEDS